MTPRYGSSNWLARLPAGCKPVGRLHGFVVIRLSSGVLVKAVGGTPEHPSVIGVTNEEERLVEFDDSIGIATVEATWVDWYNTSAGPDGQAVFDDVTKRMDAKGLDALPGGPDAGMIDQYRFTYPNIYPALLNYRDTGGRRALFAKNTIAYSDKPISTPKPDGPMVNVNGSIVLHPGRYTYSDVMRDSPGILDPAGPTSTKKTAGLFKIWLDAAIRDRKVQVLRTQVSEGLLSGPMVFNAPEARYLSTPYYMDYEFLVAVDTVWGSSLLGNPTWIPGTEDIQRYWGKPAQPSGPDFDAIRRAGKGLLGFGENIVTIAVVLGIGYVFMALGKRRDDERPVRA